MPTDACHKVAVVIPHFNRASLLRQTLDSIHQQTLRDWQVIVVDDGSTTEEWQSAQQLRSDRVTVVQRTDGPKGPSRCRNLGWQMAKAPFVIFLDSDDLMAPWCLESRLYESRHHESHQVLLFPVMLFKDVPGDRTTLWNELQGDNDLHRFLVSDPPWHTSSPLWPRSVLTSLGGFNESVMYGDDADLHMRAIFRKTHFAKKPFSHPDVFVRRSDTDRITNSVGESMLDSRLQRLRAGSKVVRTYGTLQEQLAWQGQFLVECEYLMFQIRKSEQRQLAVLKEWQRLWNPSLLHFMTVHCYLFIANLCQTNFYLGLRMARRLALILLPHVFFPRYGRLEQCHLPDEEMGKLRARLTNHQSDR